MKASGSSRDEHPVVVVGAGPVGLAATANLIEQGLPVIQLEAGPSVASHVREWGHVRLFSPWRFTVDPVSRRLLEANGWSLPSPTSYPTGRELVIRYLEPLAAVPQVAEVLRFGHRVRQIARLGVDKTKSLDRAKRPFLVVADGPRGEERFLASAVIDATGTWGIKNPLGAEGFSAPGEKEARDRISYGIPDILGRDRRRYDGRSVAVIGSGHSAQNAIRDLAHLRELEGGSEIHWVVRRATRRSMFGGGDEDELVERGRLGQDARRSVDTGDVELHMGFELVSVEPVGEQLRPLAADGRALGPVDEVIATTGQRPDFSFLRELRLAVDPGIESVTALAPLIDPNVHSCGSVPPHGARELQHPEKGFFIVGNKSYGRAPTFLMLTGYEQVRSVVAQIAGDHEAAARVGLELPETGVCSTSAPSLREPSCCT